MAHSRSKFNTIKFNNKAVKYFGKRQWIFVYLIGNINKIYAIKID